MNIFASDSELSKYELLDRLKKSPEFFRLSGKQCDTIFVQYLFGLYRDKEFSRIESALRLIYSDLCEELKNDPDVNLALIQINSETLKFINPRLVPNYDELALTAVIKNDDAFEYVKPEALSNSKVYDKIARLAVNGEPHNIALIKRRFLSNQDVYDNLARTAVYKSFYAIELVKPEYVNNYDELVKIIIDGGWSWKLVSMESVINLEETKRRDLLNYMKTHINCNRDLLDRILGECRKLHQWLKAIDEYEKEQEAN